MAKADEEARTQILILTSAKVQQAWAFFTFIEFLFYFKK